MRVVEELVKTVADRAEGREDHDREEDPGLRNEISVARAGADDLTHDCSGYKAPVGPDTDEDRASKRILVDKELMRPCADMSGRKGPNDSACKSDSETLVHTLL